MQRTTAILSIAYVVVFIMMLILRPGSKDFYHGFQNIYQIIAPCWASICCFVYAFKHRHDIPSQKV
ncbi:MAG: hypothetical protein IT203_07960, partial [Fimbriimonadaceae bacterium]|nr:hypothetical protein [Fimbriimonadaceae bacterium]